MFNERIIQQAENELELIFNELEEIALFNQEKVLNAFKKNQIALRHFVPSSGYGYGDEGKEALNRVFADVFKTEDAICSPNIVSGTHALSLSLFGVLRPNDTLLSVTGMPYDTLTDVILGEGIGSLKDFGVNFKNVALKSNEIDIESVKEILKTDSNVKIVYLQRSRGYDWRDALTIDKIEAFVCEIRKFGYNGCIMLDNCYGEFIEKKEATEVGVNLIAGSLIKNPGGGIAPTGGYIAGDKKYVDLIANRLTAPSIGNEVGSYSFGYQYFFQGLFLAPHTVLQALKGVLLFGKVLNKLGFDTSPSEFKKPGDIILAIKFNDKNKLISFIQSIQKNSPIDSFVQVLPWGMPGYNDEVIMAAGCFVQGASIELSADGPVRPPYIAYMQGGLTYEHCKIALKNLDL